MAKAGAAHHREPLSGHRAKTPLANFGHTPHWPSYRPIGSPLGRRTFAHWPHPTGCLSGQKGRRPFAYWPPLGHTLRDGAATWPKGAGLSHSPAIGSHTMPGHPLAKRGAPHWPPYRPSDAPPGPMATASLTGHLQATYWPSGEAPLATHWPQRGGKGTLSGHP